MHAYIYIYVYIYIYMYMSVSLVVLNSRNKTLSWNTYVLCCVLFEAFDLPQCFHVFLFLVAVSSDTQGGDKCSLLF